MGITHLLREMLLSEITAAVQALGVPRILRELRLSSNRATGMLFCKTITRAKTPLAFKDVLFFFFVFFVATSSLTACKGLPFFGEPAV